MSTYSSHMLGVVLLASSPMQDGKVVASDDIVSSGTFIGLFEPRDGAVRLTKEGENLAGQMKTLLASKGLLTRD